MLDFGNDLTVEKVKCGFASIGAGVSASEHLCDLYFSEKLTSDTG